MTRTQLSIIGKRKAGDPEFEDVASWVQAEVSRPFEEVPCGALCEDSAGSVRVRGTDTQERPMLFDLLSGETWVKDELWEGFVRCVPGSVVLHETPGRHACLDGSRILARLEEGEEYRELDRDALESLVRQGAAVLHELEQKAQEEEWRDMLESVAASQEADDRTEEEILSDMAEMLQHGPGDEEEQCVDSLKVPERSPPEDACSGDQSEPAPGWSKPFLIKEYSERFGYGPGKDWAILSPDGRAKVLFECPEAAIRYSRRVADRSVALTGTVLDWEYRER